MARRYHVTPLPDEGRSVLPTEVAHHLARVMRVRVEDVVVLFDGEGRECDARITELAGSGHNPHVAVEVSGSRVSEREPGVRVEVACAPPKGNRGEALFEHGTELGIAVFHPVATARSVGSDRGERWKRIVVAATGQCDRGRIPEVRATRALEELLEDASLPEERYVADVDGPPLGAAQTGRVLFLVGPEGGLTEEEVERAVASGFERRSLGVTTLRAETAVIAGAVRLLA